MFGTEKRYVETRVWSSLSEFLGLRLIQLLRAR